uniref:Uncharacterized protein n=1 Tax=Clytia hemisphaerica TaxID=252671 RepID=A0A7M6DPD7_9CNID|eukprot:TCONS_00035862-protein
MDLFSDFNDQKWDDKGTAPENIKSLEGYKKVDIMRGGQEEELGEKVFHYYMSDAGGDPVSAKLFGACRNPLKSIGHCSMKIIVKNYEPLVVGIIVEDDWVEIKQSYLDSLNVQGEPPKEPEVVDMNEVIGLVADLDHDIWCNKGDPPRNKTKIGYVFVSVVRPTDKGNNTFDYQLSDDQNGRSLSATLSGCRRNPLRDVVNCFMKIENNQVKGIIVEDDWVEVK